MSQADSTAVEGHPYQAVPPKLKERRQWLLWDTSSDTPKQPHWKGNFAISWSNPDEWHTFEQAVTAAPSCWSDAETVRIGDWVAVLCETHRKAFLQVSS